MNETATLKSNATPARGMPRPGLTTQSCPECGAIESWGNASWCPKCGYYPKLGTKVSADMLEQPAEDGSEEVLTPVAVPAWLKLLAGGLVLILIVSIGARLQIPADGPRTIWSLSQLGLGLCLLIAAHVQAFLVSGSRANGLTMLDLLLSPSAVWKPVFHRLPGTGMIVSRGAWGATAMLCAVLVTGSLGWENLSLLFGTQSHGNELSAFQKAMLLAGKGEDKSEDAPDGDDAIQSLMPEIDGPPVSDAPAMKSQCAIVGFTLDIKGNLHSVLLATMVAGKPAEFVAKLPVEDVRPAVRAKLEARLPGLRSRLACVRCPTKALWVKPELTCMIGYDPGEDARKWTNLEFLEVIDPSQPEAEAAVETSEPGTEAEGAPMPTGTQNG